MATDFWKGPNGTANAPTSGDFIVASNWSSGAVPTADVDVSLAAGAYTATLNSASAEIASLTIGTGAELSVVNGSAIASLTLHDDSTNFGRISVYGSALLLDAAKTLTNLGEIDLFVQNGYASAVAYGTIDNVGLIASHAGGFGQTIITLVNQEEGVVRAYDAGTVDLSGTTTNHGLIEADANSTVTTFAFGILGTVTNVSGSTLTGGRWAANGENSTLWLAGTTISTLDANTVVTLSGADSRFRVDDGSGDPFYLEQTLNLVDEGATLEVLGGRDWTTSETLAVRGALHLGGGTFTPGDFRAEKGSVVSGFGTIGAQAIVDGLLKIDAGQTMSFTTFSDFNGKISGGGTLELSGGSDTFTTSKVAVRHLLFDGANVQFDKSLSYAGELTVTAGTIELKDSKLTLAGTTDIGTAEIHGGPGGTLSVTGSLRAHGGSSEIDVRAVKVDGQVGVDHGTLTVTGSVTGSGGFTVGANGDLVLTGASVAPLVTLDGVNATVALGAANNGKTNVASFDGHDKIDFLGVASTGAKLTWRADADGTGGTLKVTGGGATASVHLEENHTKADFALKSDGAGGTLVTLANPSAFGLVGAGAFGADAHAAVGHLFVASHDLHAAVLA